jgi:predicted small lipoprotein YifL
MNTIKSILPGLFLILLVFSVYDCGYKGPLYLPHKSEASKTTASKTVFNSNMRESSI